MNTSKAALATLLAALALMPLAVPPASAQFDARVQANPQFAHTYSQAELDQMLAPIALYPDALLSQILMAATYPVEVIQAADWARAYPGLQGDEAVRAVAGEDWDPSVKSLVAFPQVLQRMDEKLDWTRSLGEAFLAQEQQVMSQVQQLRQRAQETGSLHSDEQIHVERQGPVIVLRSASPQFVHVPYYDPLVVYGSWWWPSYQPVAWAPWPGYARAYRPGLTVGFWWGRPVGLSHNFFFGDFDWRSRHVRVVQVNNYYYRPPVIVNRTVVVERGRWHHDPHHRRGAEYRTAEVRQRFDARQAAQPAATVQAQPKAVTPAQRAERRDDRRDDRRAERQAERQPAPAVTPAQPAAQPRAEQRDDRRAERQAAMEAQRQARNQAQQQQTQESQRQAQQQARQQAQAAQRQAQDAQRQAQQQLQQQARQQAQEAQRQVQQQARQQQAAPATMPAAQAPQTPRAERDERREKRQEARKDRDKG